MGPRLNSGTLNYGTLNGPQTTQKGNIPPAPGNAILTEAPPAGDS